MIYVHLDTMNNAVLTKGIQETDIYQYILHKPKNLLLLNTASEFGEFDSHAGLKILRGFEAVSQYFTNKKNRKMNEERKWIDFADLTMLKELSSLEISELLYLGHMKKHLHSPFFYKLQNNVAFFALKDDFARTYFRYLDEFYRVLAGKITANVTQNINEKRPFYKKKLTVAPISEELIKPLYEGFKEGIVICEQQAIWEDGIYTLPVYLVEDGVLRKMKTTFSKDEQIATLMYNYNRQKWTLDLTEDYQLYL